MKKILKAITVSALVLASHAVAQTSWSKYSANPVMTKTNWFYETYAIGQPTCLWERDTFKMWYAAGGLPYLTSRFLYAYSDSGVNWTKYGGPAPVLLPGEEGSWDVWIDTPEIVRVPGGYHLFYFGDTLHGGSNRRPSPEAAIGLASSLDGINWEKNPANPVFRHDSTIAWERHWIESPAVLYDSAAGLYRMWYSGVDTTTWHIQIGLATSPNCVNWFREASNPVVANGPFGSCDDMWASVPAVIKRDTLYEMWYSALSTSGGFGDIGVCYATSPDGVAWTKYPGNPLFTTTTPPHSMAVDSAGPWAPDVVFNEAGFRMWYETVAGFCLATAPLAGIHGGPPTPLEKQAQTLRIFPNPATNRVSFSLSGGLEGKTRLKVYDLSGRKIVEAELSRGRDKASWDCRLADGRQARPGIYFLVLIKDGEERAVAKLVIAR